MGVLPLLLSLSLLATAEPAPAPEASLDVPADAVGEAGFVAGTLAMQLRHCGASQAQLDAFFQFERRVAVQAAGHGPRFDAGFSQGSNHMHATLAAGHAVPDAALCRQLWTRLPNR